MSKVIEERLVVLIAEDEAGVRSRIYDTLGEVAREMIADGTIHDYRWEIEATAQAHLRAGHTVAVWYPVDTAGYLTLTAEGDIDIYDTRSGEAGPTTEVRCQTCDEVLRLDASIP